MRVFMTSEERDIRERANRLVSQFGSNVGVQANLDEHGDRSFGEFGFRLDPEEKALQARVYIADAYLRGEYAKPEHFRTVLQALKADQSHDRAGGEFVLDEDREMYFLVRSFPIQSTSPATLRHEMEKLINAGAQWSSKWFIDVVKAVNRAAKGSAVYRAGNAAMSLSIRRSKSNPH
jgi:hypothetical protein